MSNEIDKFFKGKLADHSVKPGPEAWSKIESGLSKKNKTIIWFRSAAVLAMIGLAIGLWFISEKSKVEQPVAINKATDVVKEIPENKIAEADPGDEVVKEPLPVVRRSKPTLTKKTSKNPPAKEAKNIALVNDSTTQQLAISNEESIELLPAIELPIESKVESKSMVIVYTLPEIKTKNESTREDELFKEKKTGLQKVMEIASEVRSESPLGGLRQAKNEILAFNFRKDKDERNNK